MVITLKNGHIPWVSMVELPQGIKHLIKHHIKLKNLSKETNRSEYHNLNMFHITLYSWGHIVWLWVLNGTWQGDYTYSDYTLYGWLLILANQSPDFYGILASWRVGRFGGKVGRFGIGIAHLKEILNGEERSKFGWKKDLLFVPTSLFFFFHIFHIFLLFYRLYYENLYFRGIIHDFNGFIVH